MSIRNQYLNYLIYPRFQGVSRLVVLSFENDKHRRSCKQYFLPAVEKKDCNAIIDGKNFFDHKKTFEALTLFKEWTHNWLFARL